MATFKKGDKVNIKTGTKCYNIVPDKLIINAVLNAVYTTTKVLTRTILEVYTNSLTKQNCYKVVMAVKGKNVNVWIDESQVSKVEIEEYNGDTKSITPTTDVTKYSNLVNDPRGADSIFTLSNEGRKFFTEDKDIKQSIFNMGIIDREDRDVEDSSKDLLLYNKFDRNGCVDPYNGFIGSKEYVFFTRPDLHLFEETNGDKINPELLRLPLFEDLFYRYPQIFEMLQSSCTKNRSPFITLLSNTISAPIQLPEISADRLLETGANAYGTKLTYHGTSHPSDESLRFSIDFTDNRYLEVFMLFKLYDEYEKQKLLGWITPRDVSYTINKILSDKISIFKIVVAEDGESILYFAKWTGCMPLNVPTDALSDMSSINGNLNLSINWHAEFFEDLDKEILQDFNAVVVNHQGLDKFKNGSKYAKDIPLYDPVTGMSNGEWATFPYIAKIKNDKGLELDRLVKMRQYKLKWR